MILQKYFDQWIMKQGHPIYSLNTVISGKEGDKLKAVMTVSQTQSPQ